MSLLLLYVCGGESVYLRSLIQVLFPIRELSQLGELVVLQNIGALWREINV